MGGGMLKARPTTHLTPAGPQMTLTKRSSMLPRGSKPGGAATCPQPPGQGRHSDELCVIMARGQFPAASAARQFALVIH